MELNFDGFKERAKDDTLSKWEKIGFPDSYRKGNEREIFTDISNKLDLKQKGIKILDIGCGCSDLVEYFIDNDNNREIYLYQFFKIITESKGIISN